MNVSCVDNLEYVCFGRKLIRKQKRTKLSNMFGLSSVKQKCVMPCNEEVPKLKAVGVWENMRERCSTCLAWS